MNINPEPTLKSHILTPEQATSLINSHSPITKYPLPTQVILFPEIQANCAMRVGTIWVSKDSQHELIGTSKYFTRNEYLVAQVFDDMGENGHVDYQLKGWLHLTTYDLDAARVPLYKYLLDLYTGEGAAY